MCHWQFTCTPTRNNASFLLRSSPVKIAPWIEHHVGNDYFLRRFCFPKWILVGLWVNFILYVIVIWPNGGTTYLINLLKICNVVKLVRDFSLYPFSNPKCFLYASSFLTCPYLLSFIPIKNLQSLPFQLKWRVHREIHLTKLSQTTNFKCKAKIDSVPFPSLDIMNLGRFLFPFIILFHKVVSYDILIYNVVISSDNYP